MDKVDIAELLERKHAEIFEWLKEQPRTNWMEFPEGKWSVGQHILHLVNSIQLLNNALSYPRFFLKYKFGIANRESRDYETVANKYQEKLIANKDRAAIFNKDLKKPTLKQRDRLLTRYQIQQKKLQYKTKKISEKNLDTLIVPHPLMGKMTVREIIMWTAHHTEHHLDSLKLYY